MPLIPDKAAFQNSLAGLPILTYQAGETVIVDGSKTGRLLILRKGNVAIVKEDTEIAKRQSLAPFLVNSLSCWISRIQLMCVPWRARSFT